MRALVLVALLLSPSLAAQPFEELSEAIDQGSFGDIKSVIISRHGKIIYESSGGIFLQDDPTRLTEWGRGRFTAIDCLHVDLEVDSPEVTTTLNLTRLTGSCEAY